MDFLRLLRVGFYNRATRSNFFAILRFFYCHTEALAEVSQNKISKVIQKNRDISVVSLPQYDKKVHLSLRARTKFERGKA